MHRSLRIRKQAPQSRRRSSAQGLLCQLCADVQKMQSTCISVAAPQKTEASASWCKTSISLPKKTQSVQKKEKLYQKKEKSAS